MNEKEKKSYLDRYHEAKEKGVPFFPDIIFKDALASLVIFIILVALAYLWAYRWRRTPTRQIPTYTPRPEWYFLFLFQLLKYFPGKLEVIGVIVLPTLMILLLVVLPLSTGIKPTFFEPAIGQLCRPGSSCRDHNINRFGSA